MKKLLFLLPVILIGCVPSQKIAYKLKDITPPQNAKTIPISVEVHIFDDNRAHIEENKVLFENPRQINLKGINTCINAEKHYIKDTVVNEFSKLLVAHFNKSNLFDTTYYNIHPDSEYYITGVLNRYYSQQQFSTAAAVGAQFGLIGALATANTKSPGEIIIDVSDLKLYKKDGTLIKELGEYNQVYKNEFKADAYCWCAYWNANLMLKDFNTKLTETIRAELVNIDF
jgi:hypothetical protein